MAVEFRLFMLTQHYVLREIVYGSYRYLLFYEILKNGCLLTSSTSKLDKAFVYSCSQDAILNELFKLNSFGSSYVAIEIESPIFSQQPIVKNVGCFRDLLPSFRLIRSPLKIKPGVDVVFCSDSEFFDLSV